MKISNKFYDLSKWVVLVFLPACSVLVGGMGKLYRWADASMMMATINLLTAFLGSLLQLSSQNYHKTNDFLGGDGNDRTSSK